MTTSISVEEFHPSAYNIVVPFDDGKCLLMNSLYHAMDMVDSRVADVLADPRRISNSPTKIVDYLTRRGYLTDMTPEAEEDLLVAKSKELDKAGEFRRSAPQYVFTLTHGCNLACSYCFQGSGTERVAHGTMTLQQATECMDIVRNGPKHPDKQSIELFGGEPLLPALRPVVEYLIREGGDLGYRFTATTNGVHLDAFKDLLGPEGIHYLQISLDGPPEIHNRRRIPLNGQPTFHTIWNNIKLALDCGAEVTLRANLDRSNLDRFPELIDFVDAEGYAGHPKLNLRYATVLTIHDMEATGDELSYAEVVEFLEGQINDHPALRHVLSHHDHKGFLDWIKQGFNDQLTRACGAVDSNVYFTPEGRIYTCHGAVGREEWSVGSHDADGLNYDAGERERWTRPIHELPACRKCPYAFICAGGCAVKAKGFKEEDTRSVECEDFPNHFEKLLQREYRVAQTVSLSDGI